MIIGRRKSKCSVRKFPSAPLCRPQIPRGWYWSSNQSSVMRSGDKPLPELCYGHNLLNRNIRLVFNNIFTNKMLTDGYTVIPEL
jgi:hypothetical protein